MNKKNTLFLEKSDNSVDKYETIDYNFSNTKTYY